MKETLILSLSDSEEEDHLDTLTSANSSHITKSNLNVNTSATKKASSTTNGGGKTQFVAHKKIVKIEDIHPLAFEFLISFFYNLNPSLNENIVVSVLYVAKKYLIAGLVSLSLELSVCGCCVLVGVRSTRGTPFFGL